MTTAQGVQQGFEKDLILQLEADQVAGLVVAVRQVQDAYESAAPVLEAIRSGLSEKHAIRLDDLAAAIVRLRAARNVLENNPCYWGKDVGSRVADEPEGLRTEVPLADFVKVMGWPPPEIVGYGTPYEQKADGAS